MFLERVNNNNGDCSISIFNYNHPTIATTSASCHADGWQTYEANDFAGRVGTGSRPIYILETDIDDIENKPNYIGKEIGILKKLAFTKTLENGDVVYATDQRGRTKRKAFIEDSLKEMKPRFVLPSSDKKAQRKRRSHRSSKNI